MRISVCIITKDEAEMLKWALRHYSSFADEIVVYDNQSTDGTQDAIKACAKARREPYDTCGVLRDDVHLKIKNDFAPDADWRIIVDTDELLWHPAGVRRYLERCTPMGVTLPHTTGWNMIGDGWPQDDGTTQLWELVRDGVPCNHFYAKKCVVKRDVAIQYSVGCHGCQPKGLVVYSPTIELKVLHYKWLNPQWTLERMRRTQEQLSEQNKENGWGTRNEANSVEQEAAYYEKSKREKVRVT